MSTHHIRYAAAVARAAYMGALAEIADDEDTDLQKARTRARRISCAASAARLADKLQEASESPDDLVGVRDAYEAAAAAAFAEASPCAAVLHNPQLHQAYADLIDACDHVPEDYGVRAAHIIDIARLTMVAEPECEIPACRFDMCNAEHSRMPSIIALAISMGLRHHRFPGSGVPTPATGYPRGSVDLIYNPATADAELLESMFGETCWGACPWAARHTIEGKPTAEFTDAAPPAARHSVMVGGRPAWTCFVPNTDGDWGNGAIARARSIMAAITRATGARATVSLDIRLY